MNDFRQDKEDSVLETINCELIKREGWINNIRSIFHSLILLLLIFLAALSVANKRYKKPCNIFLVNRNACWIKVLIWALKLPWLLEVMI
jgi:hypothetical protein